MREKGPSMSEQQEAYYPYWYPVQIRFRDLDPLAHVNNTVYFIYLEEARGAYFDQLAPWMSQWPSGEEHQYQDPEQKTPEQVAEPTNPRIRIGPRGRHYGMLVKENTCTYLLPIVHSDQVEVGVRIAHVGRTSFVMECELRDMKDTERIYATAKAVMVWCNYHTGRPYPVPPAMRAAFEKMEGRSFPAPE